MDLETKRQKALQSARLYQEQDGCCAICGYYFNLSDMELHHDSNTDYYNYSTATDIYRRMLCRKCHEQVTLDRATNNLAVADTHRMYLHSIVYHQHGEVMSTGKLSPYSWVSIGFARELNLTYPEVKARCNITDATGIRLNSYWVDFMEQCGYSQSISARQNVEQIANYIANNEDFMFDVTVTGKVESNNKIYFNTSLNYVFRVMED